MNEITFLENLLNKIKSKNLTKSRKSTKGLGPLLDLLDLDSDRVKFKRNRFLLDIPPPFPSANKLHVGGQVQYLYIYLFKKCLEELENKVRYRVGFDVNGLPLVLKAKECLNLEKKPLIKENILKKAVELKNLNSKGLLGEFAQIGYRVDKTWDTRHPAFVPFISNLLNKAEEKSLFNKGKKLCYYCPRCNEFLSKLEVEPIEKEIQEYELSFYVENQSYSLVTTKPWLTSFAEGIFVNPFDQRYTHLIGKTAKLRGKELKIFGDISVIPEYGTGIEFVATFGSLNDYEILVRNNLLKDHHNFLFSVKGYERLQVVKGDEILPLKDFILKETPLPEDPDLIKIVYKKSPILSHAERSSCKCPVELVLRSDQLMIDLTETSVKKSLMSYFYKHFKGDKKYFQIIKAHLLKFNQWCISRQHGFGTSIYNHFNSAEKYLDKSAKDWVLDVWADSSVTQQFLKYVLTGVEIKKPVKILRFHASDITRTWDVYTIISNWITNFEFKAYYISTPLIVDKNLNKFSKSTNLGNQNWSKDELKWLAFASSKSSKKRSEYYQLDESFLKGLNYLKNKLINLSKYYQIISARKLDKKGFYKKTDYLFLKHLYESLMKRLDSLRKFRLPNLKQWVSEAIELISNQFIANEKYRENSFTYRLILSEAFSFVVKVLKIFEFQLFDLETFRKLKLYSSSMMTKELLEEESLFILNKIEVQQISKNNLFEFLAIKKIFLETLRNHCSIELNSIYNLSENWPIFSKFIEKIKKQILPNPTLDENSLDLFLNCSSLTVSKLSKSNLSHGALTFLNDWIQQKLF